MLQSSEEFELGGGMPRFGYEKWYKLDKSTTEILLNRHEFVKLRPYNKNVTR